MFEEMIQELKQKPQKEYSVLKSHLNHETLPRVIAKRPKILVINCNGGIDFENKSTNLWFEDTEKPSVIDTFSESRLKVPFQPNRENNLLTSVQLAIVSGC